VFKTRFLLILLLFIISILLLIFIPNLVFLIIGWDGLGISSFYLIIFYQNQKSLGARIITLLSNRVGDLCLLLSIALFFSLGRVFLKLCLPLRFLLIIRCFTKRAQFPFMRWLPAAIAAPTPVSALVHSSTLVTAGVYLIIRFSFVILSDKRIIFIVSLISRLTMLVSAIAAMFETDFKKIIALSTLSQLGFIMFRLSQLLKICRFFHLITHAVFKSLLFICAGAVIIFSGHNQDIRILPKFSSSVIQRCFIVASLALIRAPFIVGFYSKDLILEIFFQNQTRNWFFSLLVILSSWFTVAYSIRMLFLRIWQAPNFKFFPKISNKRILLIYKSTYISAIASTCVGSLLSWIIFFEARANMPFLTTGEIKFICSFIFCGGIFFLAFLKIKPINFLLYLSYLTPLIQSSSGQTINMSKNLFYFSDLAWLEKLSYREIPHNTINFSYLFYLISKDKNFLSGLIVLILIIFLLICL